MRDTDNSADILDIRDLIARIEELRSDRDGWVLGAPDGSETPNPEGWATDEPDDAEELATLESFVEEMKGYGGDEQWEGDWYPVTLIRDSYWDEYVSQTADDLHGQAMQELSWPMNCIDWQKAGRELQMDYGSAELDGVTYWYR